MNSEEQNDRLVDSLLWELVGREMPPDVRQQVLERVAHLPESSVVSPPLKVVQAPLRSARRSTVPALAVAATLTLLGVVGALLHLGAIAREVSPRLAVLSGEVSHPGSPVDRGTEIEVGPEAQVLLSYRDGTVVEVEPETTLIVGARSRWSRAKRLEVKSGKVQAEVARQVKGREMLFVSENARARVLGTTLSFASRDGQAHLEVTEGLVGFEPTTAGPPVMVKAGFFAEAEGAVCRHGLIESPQREGITGLLLMNAETDQPIREEPLVEGEVISLAALPTRKINLRAGYDGEAPEVVRFSVSRVDGRDAGLPEYGTSDQRHPPFFVAGDYWPEGRPEDCREWTPKPGRYRFTAEVIEAPSGKLGPPLILEIQFTH